MKATIEKLDEKVCVTLDGRQISDLFFNHENGEFESFYNSDNRDMSLEDFQNGRKAALLKDAMAFAEMCGGQLDPESLVEDFLARL